MAIVWERWRRIYQLLLALLLFLQTQNCQAVTHWIVTENGRIEAKTNSLFNLQKPFDLVTFIQQEQLLNKINYPPNKLKNDQHLDTLDEVKCQEKIDLSQTFFKTDPTCSRVKRWYELDLSLNFIIPFSSKEINVANHIDLESAVKTHSIKTLLCLQNIPITMYSYDHLEGVANKHVLTGISEQGLLSAMKYVTDVDDWGDRIARALTKNSTSWVLQNMAALYWRIKGNAVQSINCLREALYYSPREHKDIALLSLALILHHANYSLDAILLLHVSLDITREVALHQYILANIYASLEMFNMTELCLKYVTLVQPAFQPALDKREVAVCERRYLEALQEQFSSLEKVLSKDKQKTLQKLQDRNNLKHLFAYDVFKKQLERLNTEPVALSESPLSDNQELISNEQTKGQEMTTIQKDLVKAISNNNIENREAFTVNIQLAQGGPVVQKNVFCQKADAQVPCKMFQRKQVKTNSKLQIDEKENLKRKKNENGKYMNEIKIKNKENDNRAADTDLSEELNKTLKSGKTGTKIVGNEKEPENQNVFPENERNRIKKSDIPKNSVASSKTKKNPKKNKKIKKKHETGERIVKSQEDESFSLQEKTLRQVEHARATIARVRSMLKTPQESRSRFKGAKNTAGPGGTGQVFLKEGIKSTKKGESVRSAGNVLTFERQGPPIKHYQPGNEQKLSCKNLSEHKNKKRKGDTFDRGCQIPGNNVPQTKNCPKKKVTSKEVRTDSGSQSTKAKISHKNNKDQTSYQATNIKYVEQKAAKLGASGKEGVLSSLREFQEAIRKSKPKQPGHEFDHRKCDFQGNPLDQLSHKAGMFSTVISIISKGVDVSQHVDFSEEISGLPKPPRCLAKIIPGSKSLGHIKGVLQVGQSTAEPETSLKQTLLSHARLVGKNMDIEEIGTRIFRALKRNPTSYIILNMAALYWRVTGDVYEAVRCLRLAAQHAHSKSAMDIPLISLESILYRGGFLEDAALLGREVLEVSPNAAIAHFALGNTLAAQGYIPEATQHFLIVLQLEPGFTPAIERLKIIQCVLWNEQKQLEKEADELRKLLAPT